MSKFEIKKGNPSGGQKPHCCECKVSAQLIKEEQQSCCGSSEGRGTYTVEWTETTWECPKCGVKEKAKGRCGERTFPDAGIATRHMGYGT